MQESRLLLSLMVLVLVLTSFDEVKVTPSFRRGVPIDELIGDEKTRMRVEGKEYTAVSMFTSEWNCCARRAIMKGLFLAIVVGRKSVKVASKYDRGVLGIEQYLLGIGETAQEKHTLCQEKHGYKRTNIKLYCEQDLGTSFSNVNVNTLQSPR